MRISVFSFPNSTLKWALAISQGIHPALLTLRFAAPETFQRVFEGPLMGMILVPARSPEKTDAPQALAQASLAVGRQSPGQLIATSPLPPALQSKDGQQMHGALSVVINVISQGQWIEAEIARNSGNSLLHTRTLAIARHTAPFDVFSAKMRKSSDPIRAVSRFRFKRNKTLKTVIQIPDGQAPE